MTRAEVIKCLADAIVRRGGDGARRTDVDYLRKLADDPRYKRPGSQDEFWHEVISVIFTGAWSSGRASEREFLEKIGRMKKEDQQP